MKNPHRANLARHVHHARTAKRIAGLRKATILLGIALADLTSRRSLRSSTRGRKTDIVRDKPEESVARICFAALQIDDRRCAARPSADLDKESNPL